MMVDLHFDITPNKKFFLDGGPNAANGGDTYLYQPGDNEMRFYAGGTYAFAVTPTLVGTGTDFAIASGKKLYLDSASSTYVSAPTTNVMNFAVGSDPQVMQLTPTGATITSGNDLTMSGGNIAMAPLKTVDGVDVSELRDQVSSVAQGTAFAFGRLDRQNGCTSANGLNVKSIGVTQNRCYFYAVPPHTNYVVNFSEVSTATCGTGGHYCNVSAKTTDYFEINCACNGGSAGVTPRFVDVVVYLIP